jgi:hypothetical protein
MDLEETDRRIVAAILRYLAEHPQAVDTCEGVRKWWLDRDLESVGQETVMPDFDVRRRKARSPSGG